MLRKSILFFMAGVVCTAIGGFLSGIVFYNKPEISLISMKGVTLVTVLYSIALFYLSRTEKRKFIRLSCVLWSILYALTLLRVFVSPEVPSLLFTMQSAAYIAETVMLLLAAAILLGKTKRA
jgi:hypothetical protein